MFVVIDSRRARVLPLKNNLWKSSPLRSNLLKSNMLKSNPLRNNLEPMRTSPPQPSWACPSLLATLRSSPPNLKNPQK